MQCDRFGNAVHCQIADNIARLRPGLLYTATLERDFGILFDGEKFRAPQVIVALRDSGIDAADLDPRVHRRIFRMPTVDLDLSIEFSEFSTRSSEKLMNGKTDLGVRLVEFVRFIRERDRAATAKKNR